MLKNSEELNTKARPPLDAFVNVTHRCNSRCIMCDVWNREPGEEVAASCYSKLPSSLKFINVSGGEAFLRSDLAEIIQVIRKTCSNADITISTNGILTENIHTQMKRIIKIDPEICVMISVDGIGQVHDNIRGIAGAFESAMESVDLLKQLGVKKLGLASVATNANLSEFEKVIKLAKKKGVDYTFGGVPNRSSLTLSREVYRIKDMPQLKLELDHVVREFLKSNSPKSWVRAYVNSGAYYYASTGKRKIPCFAGTDFFFMTPNANIYPCMVRDYNLGNLKDTDFETIWNSAKAEDFRKQVSKPTSCPSPCWMLCTVWPHMRRNKLQCINWFVPNKINAHLGLKIRPVQA